jgi:hypothetical protein
VNSPTTAGECATSVAGDNILPGVLSVYDRANGPTMTPENLAANDLSAEGPFVLTIHAESL